MKNPICVAYRYTTKSIIFFLVSSFLGQGESLVILEEKKLDEKVLPVSCSTRQKCAVTAMTLVFFISSFLLFFFFFFFSFLALFFLLSKRERHRASRKCRSLTRLNTHYSQQKYEEKPAI